MLLLSESILPSFSITGCSCGSKIDPEKPGGCNHTTTSDSLSDKVKKWVDMLVAVLGLFKLYNVYIINMKKQAVIFIILLLPFYSNSQAITPKQLLRRTTESLKEINSVIYKINRLDKHFSSKDTLITTALCSLYIAPKDKLGMYYVINSKAKSNSFNHERYNGKEYSFFNISKDTSNSVKAKNFEFADLTKQDYVSGNYNIKFLAYEIFNRKKTFQDTIPLLENDQ